MPHLPPPRARAHVPRPAYPESRNLLRFNRRQLRAIHHTERQEKRRILELELASYYVGVMEQHREEAERRAEQWAEYQEYLAWYYAQEYWDEVARADRDYDRGEAAA